MKGKPFRSWRLLLPLAWLTLTVACSLAHWYAWGFPQQGSGETGVLDTICKQVSNTAQAVNAPFWFVAWFVVHRYTTFQSALVVNAAGFGFWIGVFALLLLARRRFRRGRKRPEKADVAPAPALSRRAFLTDSVLVAGVTCAGAAGVYASCVTPWSLRLARYTLAIRGLPPTLAGLRLVQISDTHLGPRIPARYIATAVEMAMSLKPDLYLLTGDYVHMGSSYIEPAAELFRPLIQPRPGLIGTLGVLGNHDHYADAAAMSGALTGIGVRMLDNRRVFLDAIDRELTPIARRPECLCLAGVGDFLEGIVDTRAAFRDVPEDVPRILLSHNPDCAEMAALTSPGRARVDLMLSGHTHGGQVSLPFIGAPLIPSRYGSKYAHGVVQGPAFPVLVSAGVGMSLVPVRVGVRPEVVEITLQRAGA